MGASAVIGKNWHDANWQHSCQPRTSIPAGLSNIGHCPPTIGVDLPPRGIGAIEARCR